MSRHRFPSGRPVALLGAVAIALLVIALAFRWWDRYVEDSLGRWAVAELAHRTGGTYRLVLGDLSFLPSAGSMTFDSAIVTTDSFENRRREKPLPALEWRAHGCRVSRLDIPRLLLRRSFVAGELGCRRVIAGIALVSRAGKERRRASDSAGATAALEDLAGPLGLSSFRIAEVSFPDLSLRLERPGERGTTSVLLRRARFDAKDILFDPAAEPRERRSLSADRARLTATGLFLRPDSLIEIAAESLEADFIGSTLRLAGAMLEPSIPEAEWVRRVRVRRDRIRFELDSLRARGVDWLTFIATGDVGIRALELSGPRVDVLSDWRIPRGHPRRHRTPQQVAAAPGAAIRVDSLLVTEGRIVYRERRAGTERSGRISFEAVRGTILHLDLPPRGEPLRIEARARLLDQGLLAVQASVPLHAKDFRYDLSGRLGRMKAAAFNRLLSENEKFEVDEGSVEGITFRQTTRGGRAVTTLTPRYRDLSVEPTGEGGGLIGSVKRAVEEFVADAFVVRSGNPGDDGEDVRTVRTVRRYDPAKTWIQFVWLSLRDGLLEGLKE